ncbi:serine/threonine-protein kinase DCLK2 isoform X1 [Ciona intestinalis]
MFPDTNNSKQMAEQFGGESKGRRKSSGLSRNPSYGSQNNLYRARSLQRIADEKRAKKVRFYRNGDNFHTGLVYAVSTTRFRTFEAMLIDLTNRLADKVHLPHGVRVVFSLDGARKIETIQELEHGESYVCASSDTFKRLEYGRNTNPSWCVNVRTGSSASLRLRQQEKNGGWFMEDMRSCVSHESLCRNLPLERESRDFIKPKLVTIIRSGVKPRKAVRILLNKKTAHSLEQVLNDVTKAIKLDTGAVRKVYTLQGKQVQSLQDFFGNEDIFIAYGHEKLSQDDFDIDADEAKFIRPYSSQTARTPRVTLQRKGSARLNRTADFPTSPQGKSTPRRAQSLRISPTHHKKPLSLHSGSMLEMDTSPYPQQIHERYEVAEIIGDGNFAVVRECVERSTGRKFALKIIDKAKCVGKEYMIFNEVSILRRVKHPNVVRLLQDFDLKSEIYLVMELVNGGDLFGAISSASRYTERDASGMLHNLASALAHLHKLRIVHRDIKPENLLVCEYEDGSKALKLADFGLATTVTGPLYTVCGTPTYVAPEVIAQTGYGVKVDVWAAGVIIYILLCGFPPFRSEANHQEEIFDAILAGELDFPPEHWKHISESACQLIRATLHMNPKLRFSAEQILRHPWVAEDTALDRDMKKAVSNKLLTFHPTSPDELSPTKERKKRVNLGGRVLALTALDKNDRMMASLQHTATDDPPQEGAGLNDDCPISPEYDSPDAF